MQELRACRGCHKITTELKCECGGDTVPEWDGYVFILNHSKSEIAKKMNVTDENEYAIKVR